MRSILALNFKAFETSTGSNAVRLAKLADEFAQKSNFEVILAPAYSDLQAVASVAAHCAIYSQHVDPVEYGQFTGSFPVPVAAAICKGTLLNHNEKKLSFKTLVDTVKLCKKYRIQAIVCTDNLVEAKRISTLEPYAIAFEPPELIGSGKSLTNVNPEQAEQIAKQLKRITKTRKTRLLMGAGVSTAQDMQKALELGLDGVLLASAFAKSNNPKKWLQEFLL